MFINRPKLIRKQMDKHVAEGMVDQVNKWIETEINRRVSY